MYVKIPRNPNGTFKATKILIEKGLKAPNPLKVFFWGGIIVLCVYEGGKHLFKMAKENK